MATLCDVREQAAYLDPKIPLDGRVEDLLARLTLEEKVSLVHGDSKFTTAAIPRLGIPRRWLSDGPHGVREDVGPDTWMPAGRTDDFSSWMPSLLSLAATWNPDCSAAYGHVIGEEALARGKHIMLGPGVNIMRTPLNGRNFEYFGEDPHLASVMCVPYIQSVQSHHVASCIKHFAVNNQETQRMSIDVEVDERAFREIYLPAFKAAIQKADVWTLMGAYNKFRGQHCCHNDLLLNKILKQEWGFKGLVMSDWAGVHDTKEAALNGQDLEMGTEKPYKEFYLSGPYLEGLKKGEYPLEGLDDKVRRNLRVMFLTGTFDGRPDGKLNSKEHQKAAYQIALESFVLLKNEGSLLPLDPAKLKKVAVVGENAVRLHAHGGGSAGIKAFYEVTPLQGITKRLGNTSNVEFSMGCRQGGGSGMIERAVEAAKHADAVIFVGGLNHTRNLDDEGSDRRSMDLPYNQDELIRRLAEVNPNVIVVLMSGGAVEMDAWLDKTPAVLQAWYAGMEGGNALAAVLFGDASPSGKLPCSFPKKLADSPAHALNAYPGKDGKTVYEEGMLVGYRWFDTKQIEPLFAFGHGLSYTSFAYANLILAAGSQPGSLASVSFEISNTGERTGSDVAQVYVSPIAPKVPRPPQELKAFSKVALKPGESGKVEVSLDASAFSYYSPERKGWVADAGEYEILAGSSSRDIRLRGTFVLKEPHFTPDGP